MNIDLDPKAAIFLITAAKCKIAALEDDQQAHPDDEDLIAEASNDRGYYQMLISKLEKAL
jgi:hypothetical protein